VDEEDNMKVNIYIVCIVVLFVGFIHANRTVWYVHPDSALNSIQAGLDSCADNDIVLVGPGTYYENIFWPSTQGIHLVSELGPDMTIIDGRSIGRTMTLAVNIDTTTYIQGFTIQNGYWGRGGGICCSDNASPTILNNTIQDNNSTLGGGIAFLNTSPILTNNTIRTNSAWKGGGLYILGGSPSIRGNTIHANSATGAGGLYIIGGDAYISDNIIQYNCSDSMGSMYSKDCSPIIEYCDFLYNNNYGICLFGPTSQPTIRYCTLRENTGNGIVTRYGAKPLINNNNITNNALGVSNEWWGFINAEYNWWGDATGPYHPDSNPGGLGDTVSDYVDFIPWLTGPGVEEQPAINPSVQKKTISSTIFAGPLLLPEGKKCKVIDITGRQIHTLDPAPGIYFIEVDGKIEQKVIKVR
jgi:parallel beta-helix repeat protein